MPATVGIVFLPLAVMAAGLAGYALLVALGHDDFEAWAGGRILGLVLVALPSWWLGVAGVTAWRTVGAVLLLAGAGAGAVVLWQRRSAWRAILAAEAVVTVASLAVLALRLDHPEILGTEKPMDLGIMATLQRARGFPPPDMWLAGETLPYYYLGSLLWSVPLALSRVPLEIGYNLVVALLAGATAGLLWSLGRRLAGGHAGGALTAFFGLVAGTPDGLRQLFAGKPLGGLDLWASSRQVTDTITEWPLFTIWLGDLHPHLLSLPVALAAVLVAANAAAHDRLRVGGVALAAVLFGVTWAANPWAMPPTLAAVGLMLVLGDGRWRWPWQGWSRWAAAAAVAVAGWLVTAPFQLAYHPPFEGLGLVHAWTPPVQLVLWGGSLLIAAVGATVAILVEAGGGEGRGRAFMWVSVAAVTVAAAASGKPTLVLLVGTAAVLTGAVLWSAAPGDRPALALAALGVFLLAVPEVVFVRDPYGEALHRMNTVFKAYFQGWMLLALALPVLVRVAATTRRARAVLLAVLVVPALPHLLSAASAPFSGRPLGLDGLRWMAAGDRALVRALRHEPPGTSLVEAVGGAYTEYARLSAASGVPALLGWANHEGVWRGDSITPELERRRGLVDAIYHAGDPGEIRRLVEEAGVDLVAIGALEARDDSAEQLDAVAAAGDAVTELDGARLVRFRGSPATESDDGE